MKAKILLALSFGFFVAQVCSAETKSYTLKDLEALSANKAWAELIAHLSDIAPSERKTEWNRLVENACLRNDLGDTSVAQSCIPYLQSVLASEPQNAEFAWKAGKWSRHQTGSASAR